MKEEIVSFDVFMCVSGSDRGERRWREKRGGKEAEDGKERGEDWKGGREDPMQKHSNCVLFESEITAVIQRQK